MIYYVFNIKISKFYILYFKCKVYLKQKLLSTLCHLLRGIYHSVIYLCQLLAIYNFRNIKKFLIFKYSIVYLLYKTNK